MNVNPAAFQLGLTWLSLPLHPLLSVRKQPLQDFQDVTEGGAQQRLNNRGQRLGWTGGGALRRRLHLPDGCNKVAGADRDGGDVQQELLGGSVDLWVPASQRAQRRLSAHRFDVSSTIT